MVGVQRISKSFKSCAQQTLQRKENDIRMNMHFQSRITDIIIHIHIGQCCNCKARGVDDITQVVFKWKMSEPLLCKNVCITARK